MEDIQMKETPEKQPEFDPETYTNPILEECYRIKAEISAQFKNPGELFCVFESKTGRRQAERTQICLV